jgi:hypothetical protein
MISLRVGGMWKTIGKLSTMAKTLLQTSFQSKVYTQNRGSPNFGNLKLPFGSPGQNDIWVLISWPGTKYIIWGKVVGSPKSRLWWVLWICVCLWLIHEPKCCNYALINLLFGLCRSVWIFEFIVNLLCPIQSPNTPFYPRSATGQGVRPTFYPSNVFTFGLAVESIKELGGASHQVVCQWTTPC